MPLSSKERTISLIILIIALIGFIDASYLTASHYLDRNLPCILTQGCDVVTRSSYSKILNVPIALFGMLNYIGIFLSLLHFRETGAQKSFRITFILSLAAFLFSLWLIYIQAFILHAFCIYCLVSASSATIIFLFVLILHYLNRRLK